MTMIDLSYLNKIENDTLAPYASKSAKTRGRKFTEKSHPYRSEFQRDRERIIHSRAFRRLEYKTQVFVNHEGDHYRTRLTHTIEVAQISRTIARALRLNEDLAESIALAHDLGHTPFGHAGERELDEILKDRGGFEHNRQSLRVVDVLEKRYPGFDGLNLTWETREGIIKHSSQYDHPASEGFSENEQPSLEAQIIDFADEIAYNNHDLDDGISSGLIDVKDAESLGLWRMAIERLRPDMPEDPRLVIHGVIRTIINILVTDIIQTMSEKINKYSIKNENDARRIEDKIAGFSEKIHPANEELKIFLKKNLYFHHRVARMTMKARKVVRDLFTMYTAHPDILEESYREKISREGIILTATDYIAGMTDRFALEEHKKLTDPMIRV